MKPMKWCVAGRCIGTATGWDQADTFDMTIYGLVGDPAYAGPTGDVVISFERGYVESYDDKGSVQVRVDLIDAIKNCPVDHIDDTD